MAYGGIGDGRASRSRPQGGGSAYKPANADSPAWTLNTAHPFERAVSEDAARSA